LAPPPAQRPAAVDLNEQIDAEEVAHEIYPVISGQKSRREGPFTVKRDSTATTCRL
jgi:hypothetical protein